MDNKKIWQEEENKAFLGWDFAYLKNRWADEPLEWDYEQIILEHLKEDMKLLDMGTGGGEFLLTLGHPFQNTFVTEGYVPNVQLCKEKLAPLGITVKIVCKDNKLDFEDNFFDLIINRHESFDIAEVKRVLKPKGIFITQQVGGKNGVELGEKLYDRYESKMKDFILSHTSKEVENANFSIQYKQEAFPVTSFFDVGAIVYYAKIITWEFPNFSAERTYPKLVELQKTLEKEGKIDIRQHRFILVAINEK